MPSRRKPESKKPKSRAKPGGRAGLSRVSFQITQAQADFLKIFILKVQAATRLKLSRSQLMRAILESLRRRYIEFGEIENEEKLMEELMRGSFGCVERKNDDDDLDVDTLAAFEEALKIADRNAK